MTKFLGISKQIERSEQIAGDVAAHASDYRPSFRSNSSMRRVLDAIAGGECLDRCPDATLRQIMEADDELTTRIANLRIRVSRIAFEVFQLMVVLLFVLGLAGSSFAKERSYQTAKVVSASTVTVGSSCSRGVIVDVRCKDQSAASYTVTIGDRTFVLRMKMLIDAGWNTDALATVAIGGEFQVRFDERGDAFVSYVGQHGKSFETEYVVTAKS